MKTRFIIYHESLEFKVTLGDGSQSAILIYQICGARISIDG